LDKKDVQVVSEAEASLLFLIHASPEAVPLKKDALLTVCDAGGSTIDITLWVQAAFCFVV
jgi:molecular chaperone DnaK (HSP70)